MTGDGASGNAGRWQPRLGPGTTNMIWKLPKLVCTWRFAGSLSVVPSTTSEYV